jgi:hypothetical protein
MGPALDQPPETEPTEVVGHLPRGIGSAEQRGDAWAEVAMTEARREMREATQRPQDREDARIREAERGDALFAHPEGLLQAVERAQRGAATVAFQGPPGAGNSGTTVAPQPPELPARQLGPVPYDPLDPVTSTPQTIVGNQEVRTAVGLLTRARGNLAFGSSGPYTVTASFTAYGSSPYVGAGEMAETRAGGARQ